jgi:putative ABC transport system permease protein
MRMLDRKLFRDLIKLWAQSLAVALVMASGVATLILGLGTHHSLQETRAAYYERNRFGDLFAEAVRAPRFLLEKIRHIDGVAQTEGRISAHGLIDIPNFTYPVSGHFISLNDTPENQLNVVMLRRGHFPLSNSEAIISEAFASAHHLGPGAQFTSVIKGRKLSLNVSGVGLSPEFIYAIGPGDMMPDDRRFAVALENAIDMKGAFNFVTLRLRSGANALDTRKQLDQLLQPYGGTTAYGRPEQTSHAFLDAELNQLQTMGWFLPPIFFIVTAFLVNMILSRLIGLEREQIGLLKAIGYSDEAVVFHYLKMVLTICAAGLAVGAIAGIWLQYGIGTIYQRFFHFPYLIMSTPTYVYATATIICFASGTAGALQSALRVAALSPAIAMQPQIPPVYRRYLTGALAKVFVFTQPTTMALRHIARWPARAAVTAAGISVSIALLVPSLFTLGSVEHMLDVTFNLSDRQDASIAFADTRTAAALQAVSNLPGVMAAEPFAVLPVELTRNHYKKRVTILGKPQSTDISRLLDTSLRPITMPKSGLVLSEMLANILHAQTGDIIDVKIFGKKRGVARLPVTAVAQTYIGLAAYMDIDALNRIAGDGASVNGANLLLDAARADAFFAQSKKQPQLSSLALQRISLEMFRRTIRENINIQVIIYASLASIIAFGVVYNSARIQFSERARELASLRVLGFTGTEVSRLLLVELALLTIAAVPFGWLAGTALAYALIQGFSSELYRVPFILTRDTYAWSALITITAVIVSALIVFRRVHNLDLVSVLKTRD